MSDFLSNFTKNNYDGKKNPPETAKDTDEKKENDTSTAVPEAPNATSIGSRSEATQTKRRRSSEEISRAPKPQEISRFGAEETEFDPTYKKQQKKKYLLIASAVLAALVILGFIYYQLTHVKVPDFVQQDISEARAWGMEEGVSIKVDQVYDFDVETNKIISQEVKADKKIKKGSTLTVKASLGADPEEEIALPDFAAMSVEEAKAWITEQKAENVSLVEQYDATIANGQYIKAEPAKKDLDLTQYKRKDRLTVYYSKGQEVFEKNIEVPDFNGKTRAEVVEWANKNGVKLKEEKVFSESIAVDSVVSQGVTKGEKVAKNDEFSVQISKGKAIIVPDFSQYTMEQAGTLESKLPVEVKTIYSDQISYGSFISQSIEAGKEYSESDALPSVQVVYSIGKPYLKDLRGQVTEGDLPKLFFEEYRSKGAQIYYTVYYVDSSEPKGTVVEMSRYGQFLPLETTISFGISLGNLQSTTPEVPSTTQEQTQTSTVPETSLNDENEDAE